MFGWSHEKQIVWTDVEMRIEQFRVKIMKVLGSGVRGRVRKRCVTLDLMVYLIRQLCSSGDDIPVLGAPVEYLSKRREEMSLRMRRASSIARSANAVSCDIFITPNGGAKYYAPRGRNVRY